MTIYSEQVVSAACLWESMCSGLRSCTDKERDIL